MCVSGSGVVVPSSHSFTTWQLPNGTYMSFRCASLTLPPSPLIFSYNSDKCLCGPETTRPQPGSCLPGGQISVSDSSEPSPTGANLLAGCGRMTTTPSPSLAAPRTRSFRLPRTAAGTTQCMTRWSSCRCANMVKLPLADEAIRIPPDRAAATQAVSDRPALLAVCRDGLTVTCLGGCRESTMQEQNGV